VTEYSGRNQQGWAELELRQELGKAKPRYSPGNRNRREDLGIGRESQLNRKETG
jgi:hypothetical protein